MLWLRLRKVGKGQVATRQGPPCVLGSDPQCLPGCVALPPLLAPLSSGPRAGGGCGQLLGLWAPVLPPAILGLLGPSSCQWEASLPGGLCESSLGLARECQSQQALSSSLSGLRCPQGRAV